MNSDNHMQELFDKVAKHLLTQREPAIAKDYTACRYRAPDGKSCAIGCLIDDKHYKEDYEGVGVGSTSYCDDDRQELLRDSLEASLGFKLSGDDFALLGRLQSVHDLSLTYNAVEGYFLRENFIEQWVSGLRQTARAFKLSDAAVTLHA